MYVTCGLIDRHLQSRRGRRRHFTGKMSSKKLGACRPCTSKRTRRVARMATPPPAAGDRSLFISTGEHHARLVYGVVRLESVSPPPSAAGSGDPTTTPAMMTEILRPSAEPVVRWSEEEHRYSTLAAVSGGSGATTIVALIAGSRETVVHDVATGTDSPGPRLRRSKRDPAMLPVGDDTVLVMDTDVRPGRCCFEALRRRRAPGGGDTWLAEALPDPPVALPYLPGHRLCSVSAYFAMGSRAWISLPRTGTLSLDMERGTWRMEGTWELPLDGRGLFVPELGVVVGITSAMHFEPDTERCCQVCALDVDVEGGRRPPAVRRVWEIPQPPEEERVHGVAPPPYETAGQLAHLGNGRFCISRCFVVDGRTAEGWPCEKTGTTFTLVDVSRLPGGELELASHGKAHPHVWPWGHIRRAAFLQPA